MTSHIAYTLVTVAPDRAGPSLELCLDIRIKYLWVVFILTGVFFFLDISGSETKKSDDVDIFKLDQSHVNEQTFPHCLVVM